MPLRSPENVLRGLGSPLIEYWSLEVWKDPALCLHRPVQPQEPEDAYGGPIYIGTGIYALPCQERDQVNVGRSNYWALPVHDPIADGSDEHLLSVQVSVNHARLIADGSQHDRALGPSAQGVYGLCIHPGEPSRGHESIEVSEGALRHDLPAVGRAYIQVYRQVTLDLAYLLDQAPAMLDELGLAAGYIAQQWGIDPFDDDGRAPAQGAQHPAGREQRRDVRA